MFAALPAQEQGGLLWFEIALWALPTLLACARGMSAGKGLRAGWFVIALACSVVVLDKAVDLQIALHQLGQELVVRIDPRHRLKGPHAWMRVVLLGGLFLVAAAGLLLAVRRDHDLHAGKRIALAGLVGVLGYVGARLVPAIGKRLGEPTTWVIEISLWLVILVGLTRRGRRE